MTRQTRPLWTSALALAVAGCIGGGGSGDGGGGGPVPGDPCTATQHEDDIKVCSGAAVMECKPDDEETTHHWQVDDDCSAVGQVCRGGACVEAGGAADCPDLAGDWTFTAHCQAELIGETYQVSQDGCRLNVSPVGWTGSVDGGGRVMMGGDAGGAPLTCTGTARGDRLDVNCTPGGCAVSLMR